ncbi:hypothetical protein OG758_46720 [Streptomyces sp. NBC_01474]|uniref:hypothetical protein n=1 Tax=Streptomyces sp. NBC_01474 TaxID=2903880 RepID=UPI002DDBE7D1|nr:hypothetical protein [Streptomyces sp. NBC_01474]WSE00987.1 hypothetical protein OG758_46720 [Streptomyces sp. NBC_01474]
MRRMPLTLLMAAAATVALASPAVADPTPIYAPYAQAAASVSASGELLRSKNVDTVTQPLPSVYCVHISDPNISLAESVITATLDWQQAKDATIRATVQPSSWCDNDNRTIAVAIFSGVQAAPNDFFVTVQ